MLLALFPVPGSVLMNKQLLAPLSHHQLRQDSYLRRHANKHAGARDAPHRNPKQVF